MKYYLFLDIGIDLKNKDIERMEKHINCSNIYFYDLNQETIENSFDTYMNTVDTKTVKLKGNSKIIFRNPIIKAGNLLEVFPVLNLARVAKKDYMIEIYMNTIKIIARKNNEPRKISKHTSKANFLYGINSKQIVIYSDKIVSISNVQYPILDRAFIYIITQMLYEAIESQPFIIELDREEEKIIKLVKYYLSKGYFNYRDFLIDYVCCKNKKIEERLCKSSGVGSLKELEDKIRKSLVK